MCWVMPPASVETTEDSRIASSSVVLPWSTWPMIVTTGGRADELLGIVVEDDLLVLLVGGVLDRDLAVELVADQLDGLVGQRHGQRHHLPQAHHQVMILAGEMPSFSARSLTVIPDGTLTGPVGTSTSRLGSGRGAPRSRRWPALAAGLGVDHDPALALRRGAALRPRLAGRPGPAAARARSPSRRTRGVPLRRRSGRQSRACRPLKLLLDLGLRDALLAGACSVTVRLAISLNSSIPAARCSTSSRRSRPASAPDRRLQPPAPARPLRARASAHPARGRGRRPAPPAAGPRRSRPLAVDDTPHQLGLRPPPAAAGALPDRSAHDAAGSPPPWPPAPGERARRSSGCRPAPGWGSACRTRSRRCSGRGTRPPRPPRRCRACRCRRRSSSVSETMSIRQPVSRWARRAFRPSLPIASDSSPSGTTTVAWRSSSSTYTSRTLAGASALATNRAGSSFHGMMSIFSPRSSDTTMRTRDPRGPTQAPTGSTPCTLRLDRDLGAVAGLAGDGADGHEAVGDLRHLELEQLADELVGAAREHDLRALALARAPR